MAPMTDPVPHIRFTGTSIGLGEEELDQMSMNRDKLCGVIAGTDPGIYGHLQAGLPHAKSEEGWPLEA